MRSIIKDKKRNLFRDKGGQFESVLIAVVTLFIIGIILLFFNRLNVQLYDSLDVYLQEDYNNTEAQQTAQSLSELEQSSMWDYVFLAIYIGLMIQMMVLSFASRTNIVFFWIFVLLGMIILIVGTILSNMWQEVAANPEFADTITHFSITNLMLGNYFPIIVTGIVFFSLIIVFGKFPGEQQ